MSTATKRKAKSKAPRKVAKKTRPIHKRVAPKKPVEPEARPSPVKEAVMVEKSFIFALRLNGSFGTPTSMESTLSTLHLKSRFNGVLVENKPEVIGMLRKAKDYITWGEIKTAEIATLLRERGKLTSGISMTDEAARKNFGEDSIDALATALTQGRISMQLLRQKGLSPVFRLRPPSGGFEYSTKRPYGSGGELGKRGPAISNLLTRMV